MIGIGIRRLLRGGYRDFHNEQAYRWLTPKPLVNKAPTLTPSARLGLSHLLGAQAPARGALKASLAQDAWGEPQSRLFAVAFRTLFGISRTALGGGRQDGCRRRARREGSRRALGGRSPRALARPSRRQPHAERHPGSPRGDLRALRSSPSRASPPDPRAPAPRASPLARPQRPRRRPRRVRRPRRRRRRPPAHARRRYRRHHRRHHLRGRARPSRGTTRPHTPSNPAWTRARRRCPSRIQPPRLFQSRASPRAPRTRRRRRRSPPDLHARARTRTPRRRGERRSVASARRVDPGGCVATSDANARRGPSWTPPSGREPRRSKGRFVASNSESSRSRGAHRFWTGSPPPEPIVGRRSGSISRSSGSEQKRKREKEQE